MPYIHLIQKTQIKKNFPRKRFLFLLIGFILGFLIIFFTQKNFSGIKTKNPQFSETPVPESNSVVETDISQIKSLGILLLGYGGVGHPGGNLTDAIQVLYIDFIKAKVNLISIPRDLWVKLPDGSQAKINTVFSKLSEKTAKNFFGNLLSLKIDFFLGIDFVGFQRAIGLNLKGIEVDVGEILDDPWYPVQGKELETCGKTPQEISEISVKYTGFELERQFPCRYEHLLFKKGTQIMQGGEALKYVRSRHGSSAGDISRNIRQQKVLTAIRKKILTLDTLEDIPVFFKEIAVHIKTDIDENIIKFLSPAIKNASGFRINYINLSTENVLSTGNNGGAQIIQPKSGLHNWTGIQDFIKENTQGGEF